MLTRPLPLLAATIGLIAGGWASSPVRAQQSGIPLIICSERLMTLRAEDDLNGRHWSVQDRIDHVQDLFPKYLGSRFARITSRPVGDRVHFYLNNEFFLACTPEDARLNGYKSPTHLARVWQPMLQSGFDLSAAK